MDFREIGKHLPRTKWGEGWVHKRGKRRTRCGWASGMSTFWEGTRNGAACEKRSWAR
jgi:hypothetical protein